MILNTKDSIFLKTRSVFLPPDSICIGNKWACKKTHVKIEKRFFPKYGYNVKMQEILRLFFELPNVYREIYNYLQKETSHVQEGVYTSIFSGSRWKEISKLF